MNILVTNDDGFQSKGIKALIEIARGFGNVLVVAPDSARSAQSSALTVSMPITYNEILKEDNLRIISCSGTPADCVKLAFSRQLPDMDFEPDLVLSGINHGSNSSINIIYSGTMGAAIDAALYGKLSIGFSLCDHSLNADFSFAGEYFTEIIKNTLKNGLPYGVCLNVNAPVGKIKGVKYCRQSKGAWREEFLAYPTPYGKSCFWLTGDFINEEPHSADTDEWALNNGYISIQPVQTDMTDYGFLENLKK
ncbi:MAG: 5'/3'-nucleotidase SurE [Prevotellaceae bacterium]|jgi:5'-nucleotidase|nr:5'/3'-nucleotidase SurE [Prevotellaceae bacterium]